MSWRTTDEPCLVGPETVDVNGRLMLVDSRYPSSARGVIKVLEIVGSSRHRHFMLHKVADERGLPMFFTGCGIVLAFALLLSYVLALNTKVRSTPWLVVEATLYVFMVAGLLTSALFMWLFNANHWSAVNPEWDVVPSLATGSLFICALVFLIDLAMLIKNWKRWSWNPQQDSLEPPPPTVLPY